MKYSIGAFFYLVAISTSSAFVTNPATATSSTNSISTCNAPFTKSSVAGTYSPMTELGMSAVETQADSAYDTVRVDLSNGRDYPIYIGDGFDDKEAGELLRSHVEGNRALLITNDRISDWYLEKYEKMLKEGGDIQVGESCMHFN